MKKFYINFSFIVCFVFSLNAVAGTLPTVKIIFSDPNNLCQGQNLYIQDSVEVRSISDSNLFKGSVGSMYINPATYTDVSMPVYCSGALCPGFEEGYQITSIAFQALTYCDPYYATGIIGTCLNSDAIVKKLNQKGENMIIATPVPKYPPSAGLYYYGLDCIVNGSIISQATSVQKNNNVPLLVQPLVQSLQAAEKRFSSK